MHVCPPNVPVCEHGPGLFANTSLSSAQRSGGMYANTSLTMAQAAYVNAARRLMLNSDDDPAIDQWSRAHDAMSDSEFEVAYDLFHSMEGDTA